MLWGEGYEVQRYALLLLFAQGVERDDPVIERIQREHSDARIRELIEEGVQPRPH